MAVHGDRPPGGTAVLNTVATGRHIVGDGSAGDPLDLAPTDVARIDALHDPLREEVEWTLTLASHDDGITPSPDTIGYAHQISASRAGFAAPNLVYGAISPQPPVWTVGADSWRILSVYQVQRGDHAIGISFGAPATERVARGAAALAVGAADRWVAVPGVTIPASRNTVFTVRVPGPRAGTVDLTVESATLRALTAAAAGGDATTEDAFVLMADSAAGRWRAGRTPANGLLLAVSATGAPDVAVLADDGAPAAEAAELPIDWDWRIGDDLILRRRDATETYGRRAVVAGQSSESVRTLEWTGHPGDALAVGDTTLHALGPAVVAGALAANAGPGLRAALNPATRAVELGVRAGPGIAVEDGEVQIADEGVTPADLSPDVDTWVRGVVDRDRAIDILAEWQASEVPVVESDVAANTLGGRTVTYTTARLSNLVVTVEGTRWRLDRLSYEVEEDAGGAAVYPGELGVLLTPVGGGAVTQAQLDALRRTHLRLGGPTGQRFALADTVVYQGAGEASAELGWVRASSTNPLPVGGVDVTVYAPIDQPNYLPGTGDDPGEVLFATANHGRAWRKIALSDLPVVTGTEASLPADSARLPGTLYIGT